MAERVLNYNQMVVDALSDEAVNRLFHALADSTRRDILRRAAAGELSVSRLAEAYPMSFAAVQKHVAVLEGAGLVIKVRHGREQLVSTAPDAVDQAHRALDALAEAWEGRLNRMSELLAQRSGARKNPEGTNHHEPEKHRQGL